MLPLRYREAPAAAPYLPWCDEVWLTRGGQRERLALTEAAQLVSSCGPCAWRWRERDLWFQESLLACCQDPSTPTALLSRALSYAVGRRASREQRREPWRAPLVYAIAAHPGAPLDELFALLPRPSGARYAGGWRPSPFPRAWWYLLQNPALPLFLLESGELVDRLAGWVGEHPSPEPPHALPWATREIWLGLRRTLRATFQHQLRAAIQQEQNDHEARRQRNAALQHPDCPHELLARYAQPPTAVLVYGRWPINDLYWEIERYLSVGHNPSLSPALRRAILGDVRYTWHQDESHDPIPTKHDRRAGRRSLDTARGARRHCTQKRARRAARILELRVHLQEQLELDFYRWRREPAPLPTPERRYPKRLKTLLALVLDAEPGAAQLQVPYQTY